MNNLLWTATYFSSRVLVGQALEEALRALKENHQVKPLPGLPQWIFPHQNSLVTPSSTLGVVVQGIPQTMSILLCSCHITQISRCGQSHDSDPWNTCGPTLHLPPQLTLGELLQQAPHQHPVQYPMPIPRWSPDPHHALLAMPTTLLEKLLLEEAL